MVDRGVCPVCKSPGVHTCSACKSVSYCSKEHQKDHWKIHKVQCRPYDIKSSKELGRYLVSNRDLPRDTILISEFPLVFGPKIAGAAPQCLGCYQPVDPTDPKTPRCPRCRWPMCSNACLGIIHKDHHLPECLVLCNNLAIADSNNFMYEAIFPLRCLLLQKKNPRKWQQLLSLESHVDERNKDKDIFDDVEKIASYICDNFLEKLDSGSLPDMSRAIIRFICGVTEVNSLEITTGRGEVHALYPSASLMEHNCVPNTKHYFHLDDFKINVLAVVDIKKGDNVSTMYTHILWGTLARREHLKATKFFTCQCKRCSDPTELGTHLSSLKCIGVRPDDVTAQCSGVILPSSKDENADWTCGSCSASLTASHVSDLTSRISADVDEALENPTASKLEQFLTKLEKLLHKNHYQCFMVKHSLIQLYGRDPGYDKMADTQLNRKIGKNVLTRGRGFREKKVHVLSQGKDMCTELLGIIDVIDPGHGRVALYSAVAQVELHAALVEKSRRAAKDVEKDRLLTLAKKQLENCVRDLAHEPPFSPGASMSNLAKSHLIQINHELKKFKIIEL